MALGEGGLDVMEAKVSIFLTTGLFPSISFLLRTSGIDGPDLRRSGAREGGIHLGRIIFVSGHDAGAKDL